MTIFKLITYKIIRMVRERNHGYEDEDVKLNSLLYADDGLILADSVCEAERKIEEVS